MYSVGTKSVRSAKRQLTKAMELMGHAQLVKPVKLKSRIQNVVGLIDLNRSLDVNYVATKIPQIVRVIVVAPVAGRKEIHHCQEHMAFVRSTC